MHGHPNRPFLPSALRGFSGHCPACGNAPLFRRFLKPVARCQACGQDWTLQQADDFPAYVVILILGHLIIPVVITVNLAFQPSLLAQMLAWPMLTAVLGIAMIQPVKGAIIAWQWSRRMHGF